MFMKRIILVFLTIFISHVYAQVPDINFCYQKAIENYPMYKQKDILNNINELKVKSINTNYLPQVNINGQATYQSDVTTIPIKIPGINIPELSKDMYKATLDVNQLIYDGGTVKYQRTIDELGVQSDKQNVETELYKLKERINQLYFGVLVYQKNIELLEISKQTIKSKLKEIESGIRNGTINEVNADKLNAEIINLDQNIIELNKTKQATIKMLGELISVKIADNTMLSIPVSLAVNESENVRPELKVFDITKERLLASKSLLSSKLYPKLYGFGEVGYGRPGLNMLNNDFQSFYIVGAKLSWNLWNWNQTKTDKKIIDLQADIISLNKDTYSKNITINKQKDLAEIEKFDELLIKDQELITLRTKIAKTTSSQFDNGTITSSDYLNEVNAETQAKINYEMHKIQLIKAKYDYLVNLGKL